MYLCCVPFLVHIFKVYISDNRWRTKNCYTNAGHTISWSSGLWWWYRRCVPSLEPYVLLTSLHTLNLKSSYPHMQGYCCEQMRCCLCMQVGKHRWLVSDLHQTIQALSLVHSDGFLFGWWRSIFEGVPCKFGWSKENVAISCAYHSWCLMYSVSS